MRWSELIAGVRDRLQETTEAFFETNQLMDLARRTQAEIAAETWCCEGTDSGPTTVDVREVALPADCLNLEAATCGGRLLAACDFRSARTAPETSGRPMRMYVRGGCVGLDPIPATAETLSLWYVRRPPLGAFTLTHDGGAGATAAAVSVADGTLTLTVTGGTNAGSYAFDPGLAGNDTMEELAEGINTLSRGFTAMVTDTCRGAEASASLEPVSTVSCYKTVALMDLAVEIPAEWQWLIEAGVLYRALWKDTEFGAGEFYRKEYTAGMERMRRQMGRRRTASGASAIRDRYGSAGRGADAGMKVIIP